MTRPSEADDSTESCSPPLSDSAASTRAEADMHTAPVFVNPAVSSNVLHARLGPFLVWLRPLCARLPSTLKFALQALLVWQLHIFEILITALTIDSCSLLYCRSKILLKAYKRFSKLDKPCECVGVYTLDSYAKLLLPFVLLSQGVFPGSRHYHAFRIWLSRHPPDEHLASNDEIWRNDSPDNNCLIVGVFVTQQKITLEHLRHAVLTRWVDREYKLRSITEERDGRTVWSVCNLRADSQDAKLSDSCYDPDKLTVAVSDLVKSISLLPVATSEITKTTPAEAAVHQFLSELASRPMRKGMPLWEMYLVNNVDDHSYITVRCHHAILDGAACAHAIANRLFDPAYSPAYTFESKPSHIHASLFYIYQAVRTIIIGIPPLLKWLLWFPASPSLIQRPPETAQDCVVLPLRPSLGGKKCFAPCVRVPLADVRATARGLSELSGVHFSIHDLLTVCSVQAADDLRRGRAYDIASKIRAGEKWCIMQSGLMETRMVPASPVASRADDRLYTLLPMTCRVSMPSKMDNFTAPIMLGHPYHRVGNKGESVWSWDHLLAVREVNAKIKENKSQFIFFIFVRIFSKVIPRFITKAVVQRALESPISTVSNVAGPRHEARLCGQRVSSIQFWAPTGGRIPVGLAFLSYNGQLQISATFDNSEVEGLLGEEGPAMRCDILSGIYSGLIAEKLYQVSEFVWRCVG